MLQRTTADLRRRLDAQLAEVLRLCRDDSLVELAVCAQDELLCRLRQAAAARSKPDLSAIAIHMRSPPSPAVVPPPLSLVPGAATMSSSSSSSGESALSPRGNTIRKSSTVASGAQAIKVRPDLCIALEGRSESSPSAVPSLSSPVQVTMVSPGGGGARTAPSSPMMRGVPTYGPLLSGSTPRHSPLSPRAPPPPPYSASPLTHSPMLSAVAASSSPLIMSPASFRGSSYSMPGAARPGAWSLNPSHELFAIGGMSAGGVPMSSVERYVVETDNWSQFASLQLARFGHATAVLDAPSRVLCTGGCGITGEVLDSCECMDASSGSWAPVAPMLVRRLHHSLVALAGKVYAIGGFDNKDSRPVGSVECYDPCSNSWTAVPSLRAPRQSLSVTAVEGRLLALSESCVEGYDPRSDRWDVVSPTPHRSHVRGFTVVPLDGSLVAIGGLGGGSRFLDTMDAFDPSMGHWLQLPSINVPRYGHAATLCAGEDLFVAGGYNGRPLSTVESFSPITHKWAMVASMQHHRQWFALACT